jgi:hypothetical protein
MPKFNGAIFYENITIIIIIIIIIIIRGESVGYFV